MKQYFAKYLPIEGDLESQIWQWYNNIQNTGWELISCSNMDAVIAHGLEPAPQFRRVKLFLCSRDIQVGDRIYNPLPEHYGIVLSETVVDVYKGEGKGKRHKGFYGIRKNEKGYYEDAENEISFKIIGEISPDATWVKEGDEFDNSQLIWQARDKNGDIEDTEDWAKKEILKDEYGYYTIGIKGPCGHFH